jgi:hypothetical protein
MLLGPLDATPPTLQNTPKPSMMHQNFGTIFRHAILNANIGMKLIINVAKASTTPQRRRYSEHTTLIEMVLNILILKASSLPLLKLRLKWRFGLRCDPRHVPARAIIPVQQRRMRRHAVVPNNNGSWRPLYARLEILALRDVVV